MSEIENKTTNSQPQQPEEQEIDLIELAQKVWAERKLVLKTCGYALLIGIVVAISIPKEYTTSVTLAPETSGKSGGGNMGALAAMTGVNLGNSSGEDALSVDLYPDIVSSTPFLTDLFDIKITDKKEKIETTLYDYLKEHQQLAWWGHVFSFPFKVLGWVTSLFKEDEPERDGNFNLFMLTQDETEIVKDLSNRITVSVDKKTGMTTLSITMQDPLISAIVTNVVMHNLQNYITDYRTNKARHDLEFTGKLFKEAKEDYNNAQQKYAQYVDKNRNTILQTARVEEERLANEKNLTYNVYNQIAQQLQMAKAKVQEITPVYTVVQPATVPLKPSKPNKILILVGFIFLGGVGSVGWILFVKDLLKTWKEKQLL
ncbi:hypothetical protein EZS27_001692 [termite gut metagenome]|uniref:Polysaccharide chain length determinant N-terminal domain-containing protein n=1 Tax=termite gut metagenome TaxID=433724 RepID=A0A5J4T0T2_9ZZZZ